jgi:hypothetical protein
MLGRFLRWQANEAQTQRRARSNLQCYRATAVPARTTALRLDSEGGNASWNLIFLDDITWYRCHQAFLIWSALTTREKLRKHTCGPDHLRAAQSHRRVL